MTTATIVLVIAIIVALLGGFIAYMAFNRPVLSTSVSVVPPTPMVRETRRRDSGTSALETILGAASQFGQAYLASQAGGK